jgi:CRISPR-associated endonuclease/helicase Cas3
MEYWAKTIKDGTPGIDVSQHMLRVALVAKLLAEQKSSLFELNVLDSSVISYLAGLHDIGKISPGFQSKCHIWLEQNDLLEESIRNGWGNLEDDHSKVTQFTVQRLLAEDGFGMSHEDAIWWAASIGGHHGRLHNPGDRGLPEIAGMCNDEWEKLRRAAAMKLLQIMDMDQIISLPSVIPDSPALWLVAGLASIADWIGSDENFFPENQELAAHEIKTCAAQALESIGMHPPQIRQGLTFIDMFPKLTTGPNSLQTTAMEYIRTPGIYAIEAPMGMGKTEAALACAYHLLCAGTATGIYFALPTQATSNRIYLRLDDFVRLICPDATSTRLIHANSWLREDVTQLKPASTLHEDDDARRGRDWFASAKRALIAPFGVGTVDQALLSVVAAKHFFVRRFALAGKVVIIDEVHSDVYTGTLIGTLCVELQKLGCTIILLSATLTRKRRNALLESPSDADNKSSSEPYPLISGLTLEGRPLAPVKAEGPVSKTVSIRFYAEDEALKQGIEHARKGACILWVCNTVARAQQTYRRLNDLARNSIATGLLHARFPFFRRQELEDYWMSVLGKDGERPKGCILVSTQIVEQSVDLDADLIITELAPTDMLLQRMGRLWRHVRAIRPLAQPEYWIIREKESIDKLKELSPLAIKKTLGTKARVYFPYVLLRTLEAWSKRPTVTLPGEIRTILEETYADRDDTWLVLRNEIEGEGYARRMKAEMAANIFNPALPDEEGVQTRLNDVPMVSLILSRHCDKKKLVLINSESCWLDSEDFDLNAARSLHRNLVRVPKWVFNKFRYSKKTERYVRGDQAIALLGNNNFIEINGLKRDVKLSWDNNYGIEILFEEGVDNESCD